MTQEEAKRMICWTMPASQPKSARASSAHWATSRRSAGQWFHAMDKAGGAILTRSTHMIR